MQTDIDLPGSRGESAYYERAVIGAMLQAPTVIRNMVGLLDRADFWEPRHATMFAVMTDLYTQGKPTDAITITAELQSRNELTQVGGAPYLHRCISEVPTVANAVHYAKLVTDLASRRRLMMAGGAISRMAIDASVPIDEAHQRAAAALADARLKEAHISGVEWSDLADTEFTRIMSGEPAPPGLSTGVGALDDELGRGLHGGRLILFGGRPGMGKSVGLTQIAALAGAQGQHVAMFSLEMGPREIFARVLARQAGVSYSRIMDLNLNPYEQKEVDRVTPLVRAYPIHLDVNSSTLVQIRTKCERLAQTRDLAVIIVDYIQLVGTARRTDNRAQEVGEIAQALKNMAREFEVPVVAAASLNRQAEHRSDKVPGLADLRESGDLESAADQVILLHRPDYYNPADRPQEVDFIIAKNRHGQMVTVTGKSQLVFSRFSDDC
jgi:replicative DNA helicase